MLIFSSELHLPDYKQQLGELYTLCWGLVSGIPSFGRVPLSLSYKLYPSLDWLSVAP